MDELTRIVGKILGARDGTMFPVNLTHTESLNLINNPMPVSFEQTNVSSKRSGVTTYSLTAHMFKTTGSDTWYCFKPSVGVYKLNTASNIESLIIYSATVIYNGHSYAVKNAALKFHKKVL